MYTFRIIQTSPSKFTIRFKHKLNPYPFLSIKNVIDDYKPPRECGHTYKMISQYFNPELRGKKFTPSCILNY